ncbi:carbohydrate-binding protein [bacterium]|nr:carbohydrate-binding protein [bacterium]
MRTKYLIIIVAICMASIYSASAQTVSSLADLRTAIQQSNQSIVMTPGNYNMEDLNSNQRSINCSGSNNTIDLTGVYVKVPVGSTSTTYIVISGDNNTLIGGEFEDTYKSGLTEVTDFGAYNQDRKNLANGLGGAAVMDVTGNDNLVDGIKLTVRGSFPYGYGSMYGINQYNTFGLDKRCGLLITGLRNTIDNAEVQQRAFGHGIYMQGDATETLIKNTLVEGRVRHYDELYEETEAHHFPYRTNYLMPEDGNVPYPTGGVFSLSEDAFRVYNIPGSIKAENCTAKKMRGGIRFYLAGSAVANNCTAIDCGSTNFNMPYRGIITESSGNFAYAPLSDFRLSKSQMNIEWTIIPSPHASGPHNLADVLGNKHTIVFHRTPGPLDPNVRPIVITGDNSTIRNETEYPIILASTANGDTIRSCGLVIDNGSGNIIIPLTCTYDAFPTIEAEDCTAKLGVEITTAIGDEGGNKISSIDKDDWMEYEIDILSAGTYSFDYRVSGGSNGDFTVTLNNETIDAIAFTATGDDETWKTVHSASPIYFDEGIHTIRVTSNVSGWNLNWIKLYAECYKTPIIPRINTIDLQGNESGLLEKTEASLFPGFSLNLKPEPMIGGSWSWTGPNEFSSTKSDVSLTDVQKNQSGEYIAVFTNACGTESKSTFNISVLDSVHIEAEDYKLMDKVTTEGTSDVSGVSNVTSIVSGSWMEYEVNIPFSALYSLNYRVASANANNKFDLSINTSIADQVSFNNTGGAQTWKTINSESSIFLKAGVQTIRISSKSNDWKINWIELKADQPVAECKLPHTMDGFIVKNNTVEWSSGVMNISCEPSVDVHFSIDGIGTLGASDYLNIYYKLDGAEPVVITKKVGDIDEMMTSTLDLSGATLELIVESHSESLAQYYKVPKILILNGKDPFARIEAEEYDLDYGTNTENCSDTGGGENVGSIHNDDWLMFSDLNLSDVGTVDLRLATIRTGSTVEIRIDSHDGELLGTADVPNTNDWQKWETVSINLSKTIGFHDVYLVFKNSSTNVGNINWLQFSASTPNAIKESSAMDIALHPNPVSDKLIITNCKGANIEVYNTTGSLIIKSHSTNYKKTLEMNSLNQGIYFVRIVNTNGSIKSYKVIKQ